MKIRILREVALPMCLALACVACHPEPEENGQDMPSTNDTIGQNTAPIEHFISHVQPMCGLVLWPDLAAEKNSTYGEAITLEFVYCLPCKVVTGKSGDKVQYNWAWLDSRLDDIASRGHQAVLRWRYVYPSSTDVDGKKGTTAVPQYIKDMPGYEETYSANPGGDGPTYYADWRSEELQWFTKQFISDFAARYNTDPRIAFLEAGFGHWGEYHTYGTKVQFGVNFPTKAYQKEYFLHLNEVVDIPWAVSIDAADDAYTPFLASPELLALPFGTFDDSFMHKDHELGTADGYNEANWRAIGSDDHSANLTRWRRGVSGGEVSYYTSSDQKNFLNPEGMYGHTWEEQAAKYHITFMIANDASGGKYGTAARFREAGMAAGYRLQAFCCKEGVRVTNAGVAPLYRDAYITLDDMRCEPSLKGLCPGDTLTIVLPHAIESPAVLSVKSDYILPGQEIELEY